MNLLGQFKYLKLVFGLFLLVSAPSTTGNASSSSRTRFSQNDTESHRRSSTYDFASYLSFDNVISGLHHVNTLSSAAEAAPTEIPAYRDSRILSLMRQCQSQAHNCELLKGELRELQKHFQNQKRISESAEVEARLLKEELGTMKEHLSSSKSISKQQAKDLRKELGISKAEVKSKTAEIERLKALLERHLSSSKKEYEEVESKYQKLSKRYIQLCETARAQRCHIEKQRTQMEEADKEDQARADLFTEQYNELVDRTNRRLDEIGQLRRETVQLRAENMRLRAQNRPS